MAKNKDDEFVGPKSICMCGHTGDGEGSQHDNGVAAPGHGKCLVSACSCSQFSWARFSKKYENFVALRKGV
jgi:hypothetical protein